MERQGYDVIPNYCCFISVVICFFLTVVYVASFYVWKSPYDRDHDYTIIRRFISTFIMLFVSPAFLYLAMKGSILEKTDLFELLGLKTKGLCQAFVMPLFLTMILFLGPISAELYSGLSKLYTEPLYWKNNLTNLIWLRTHVVAPLSEEFTFRSCMLPALWQCFSPLTGVFVCPLFFGFAHFHHMYDRVKNQNFDFSLALKISCFQFLYTTIFGIYSGYIFMRTGHFASAFIIHSFCNHMGFPDILELYNYKDSKRRIIILLYFLGVIFWILLLRPLTEPRWYYNDKAWYLST